MIKYSETKTFTKDDIKYLRNNYSGFEKILLEEIDEKSVEVTIFFEDNMDLADLETVDDLIELLEDM